MRLRPRLGRSRRRWALSATAAALALSACSSAPPVPDWQLEAKGSLERATEAWLSGEDRVAALEFQRARSALARTGQPALVARAELLRCATQAASLQFGPCPGFEALRADAPAAEQAYADWLLGPVDAGRRALLPPAQQTLAADGPADPARLQALADPLSRLLGAALWLRDGRASPAVLALAVDTASAQGWRRPLLAWLGLQHQRAEQAGDTAEAARLARRMALVLEKDRPRSTP